MKDPVLYFGPGGAKSLVLQKGVRLKFCIPIKIVTDTFVMGHVRKLLTFYSKMVTLFVV